MKLHKLLARTALLITTAAVSSTLMADDWREHDNDKHRTFNFALIGDTPYGAQPGAYSAEFDNLVKDINVDRSINWVLHAGDIKNGSSLCSDELFYDRLARYNKKGVGGIKI
jgi:hypothetical protein